MVQFKNDVESICNGYDRKQDPVKRTCFESMLIINHQYFFKDYEDISIWSL